MRLLILSPNWLGDVVMHTPLLSFLHEHRDAVAAATGRELVLHLGIRSAWADLFRRDSRVDEVMVIERDGRQRGLAGTFRLASRLRRGEYDAVLVAPPSLRTGAASWLARIPCRVGYRSDGRGLFLSAGLPVPPRGSMHYAQEMIRLGDVWLQTLGLPAAACEAGTWPAALPGCDILPAADLTDGPAVWALALGNTFGQAKTWPVARVGDFLELAVGRAGVRVVLLGDEAAQPVAAGLRPRFDRGWAEEPRAGATILDLTGRTNLTEAASVLKASAAFIGNDSGLMHLAAALGVPTVGIFGSSNPAWTAPLGPRALALAAEGFSCRPCYRKTCNQKEFCLDTVQATTVLAAVQDLVTREPASREGLR